MIVAKHTCWTDPGWDGCLDEGCAGCRQAEDHPCHWCGYGHVFTTHSDLAHAENGDPLYRYVTDPIPDAWHDSPHTEATLAPLLMRPSRQVP